MDSQILRCAIAHSDNTPRMTPDDERLRAYLQAFEEVGQRVDDGAFTLDPRRAAETLRSQGRLGVAAPLYLLAAIHQHCAGSPIDKADRSWSWRLSWDPVHGALPDSLERLLAVESFRTHAIVLTFEPDGVLLKHHGGLHRKVSSVLEHLFAEVQERLVYYPWRDSSARSEVSTTAFAQRESHHCQLFLAAPRATPSFVQVVKGINYPRRWLLPIDAICFDELSKSDLSLSVIPDSARRAALEEWAELCYLEALEGSMEGQQPYRLHANSQPSIPAPLYVRSLAYLLRQTRRPDLGRQASRLVLFGDAFGRDWSVEDLFAAVQRDQRLLVVPAASAQDLRTTSHHAARPVLLWGGEALQIGEKLFSQTTSGAGYLYSLEVNEKERERVSSERESRWASCELEAGRLSLLAWGDTDRTAEVEFVGPRRATETFYLEHGAPKGMRLLWQSDRAIEESQRSATFELELRQTVLELLDQCLQTVELQTETLLDAIAWARAGGNIDWSRLPSLSRAPLLEDATERRVSLAELWDWQARHGAVPVLLDRSTSLPKELPIELLLWWHPLLEQLSMETREMGKAIREAHWREQGRERWLASHRSSPPHWGHQNWSPWGPHRIARQANEAQPTLVSFWREGRPFGVRSLTPEQCPPGFAILWVEDDLPGDVYWSGPDPEAVKDRIPTLRKMCRELRP